MSAYEDTRLRRESRAGISGKPSKPFAMGLPYYSRAGWMDLLAIIRGGPRDKNPAYGGYHGRRAKRASDKTLKRWLKQYAAYNIALVLPRDVIGLDVDHYGDKRGGDTLAKLEAELGPLPATVMSTSRDDGISGIRLYRVPADYTDANWKGIAGDDIDIICWYERYVICAPSVHATGREYRWIADGKPVRIPTPDSLPELPEAWCEYLTGPRGNGSNGRLRTWDGSALEWLTRYGSGEMCAYMDEMAPKWLAGLDAGSAYESMKGAVAMAVKMAAEGHTGLNSALWPVRDAYIDRVGSRGPGQRRRGEPAAVEEWRRAVDGAVAKWGGAVMDGDSMCDELEGL